MLKKLLIMLMLILYTFNLTACIYSNNAANEGEPTKNIRYVIDSLPQGFAYSREDIYNNLEVYSALFQGLIAKNKDNEVLPVLSEDYEILDNGLEYRFYLREDIFWSDGRHIIAQDFVNFFQELLSPQGEDYLAEGLKAIYGVSSYHKGSVSFEKVAIMATQEDELVFRLNYPYEELLEVLARPEYYLRGSLASLESLKEGYEASLYTGAFTIEGYDKASMLLSRNPYYSDTGNIFKSNIEITQRITTEKTLTDFYLGKVDLFKSPPISEISVLKDNKNITERLNHINYGLYFSAAKEDIDLSFKQAINKAIYAYSLGNHQKITFGEYAYGEAFYEKASMDKSIAVAAEANKDPISHSELIFEQSKLAKLYYKASALLTGDENSSKKQLILLVGSSTRDKKLGNFIKSALKNVLDLECRLRYGSPEDTPEERYHIYIGAFETDNKEAFLSKFYSEAKDRALNYENKQYDALFKGYLMEENALRKQQLLEASKNFLQDNYAYIPLFFEYDIFCHRNTIEGISIDRDGRLVLKDLNKFKISEESLKEKPIKDLTIPIGKGLPRQPFSYFKL